MIENLESVKPPAGGSDDIWQYVVGFVGTVIATLAGLVGMFYKSIETRNAKDIAALTALNEKLTREVDDLKKAQAAMMAENAVLKAENQTLKNEIRELETRIARYEDRNK